MKRVLSGIKPTGYITLGNYLGAMKRWAAEQDNQENFFFVPDLHALNVRPKPEELRHNTLSAVAWLLAVGVDPAKSVIFLQSQVPAHSEMMWILNNYVTFGELNRMTQFKDKSQKVGPEGQVVGLFNYPVLMAADILLYDPDEVPIGDDQQQHVEITRDIAERFNKLYGATFKVPKQTVQAVGARIMNLQDPTQKMSKSDQDTSGVVMLSDSLDEIHHKIKRAVTDSNSRIEGGKPGGALRNLFEILALVRGQKVDDLVQSYTGKGYNELKNDLAEAVVSELNPVKQLYDDLMKDEAKIKQVLEQGRAKAEPIANRKVAEVKAKVGLIS